MSRIEELRQVTDQTLHGLTADDSLKFRILQKAAGGEETKKPYFKPVPVFCVRLALPYRRQSEYQLVEKLGYAPGLTAHAFLFKQVEGF